MSSSTFKNTVLTPRTRGKGSGSPFKLFNFISVLLVCLLLQVNSAFAQGKPPDDIPPACTGCTSEDIKALGITINPPLGTDICQTTNIINGATITVNLDVTSQTRYGFYIYYTLVQINPITNVETNLGTFRECFNTELAQGPYALVLQEKPDLVIGQSLQLRNVLTAWGNQVQEINFCATQTSPGVFNTSIINEANVTCSKLDPKCKLYPNIAFNVIIKGKPNISSVTSNPVCAGSNTSVTIAGTPGSTVGWKINNTAQTNAVIPANGILVAQIPSSFVVTPSFSVTITSISKDDCPGDPFGPVVFPVSAPATVDAGPFQIVCSDQTITLTGTASTQGVTWSGGAGTITSTNTKTTNYIPTQGEIGTGVPIVFTLTTADPDGNPNVACPAVADMVTVTINRAPSFNASQDVTICQGSSTALTVTNLVGATSVTFSAPGGAQQFTNVTATSATFTPAISSGLVTVTVTSVDGDGAGPCGTTTRFITVRVNPRATLTVGGPYEVCANSFVDISVSNLGGATSVTFEPNASGSYSMVTATNARFTPSIASGNVTITVNTNDPDGAGPCTAATGSISIKVFPIASLTVTGDRAVCAGGSTVLTATNLGSSTTATFTLPNGGGQLSNVTPTSATFTPSIASGTVTVTVMTNNPDGPCDGVTQNIGITVNGVATANAGTYAAICGGSNIMLMGTFGGAATSASWQRIGAGTPGTLTPTASGANQANATYVPSAQDIVAGTVSFRLTTNEPEGPCEAASSLATVTINPPAGVRVATNVAAVCAGGSVTVTATLSGSATTASFATIPANTGSFGSVSYNGQIATVTYTSAASAGTVTITATTNNPEGVCEPATASTVLRVDGKATVGAMTTIIVCQGQQATLAGSVGGTASTLTWSGGGGTYDPNNTTGNAKYLPSGAEQVAGSVVLTLTSNDPAGECPAAVGTVTITINRAATVSITSRPVTTCAGVPVALTATSNGIVTWSVPGNVGNFIPNPGLSTQFTPTATGVFTVTATAADPDGAGPCGTATSTVVITVNTCGTGFCTYTQGYFGQDRGNGKASYLNGTTCTKSGSFATIAFALSAWGGAGMPVSNMTFSNTVNDIAKIAEYLPGGGPSDRYPAAGVNGIVAKAALSSSSPKNTLLAQTMTLGLNMGLNSTLGAFTLKNEWLRTGSSSDCGANGDGLSTQCFKFNISANMNVDNVAGVQINDIWILANRALKGEAVPVSLSMIAGAADAVNNAFDECRVPLGWSETNPCVTTAPTIGGVANVGSADRSASTLTVKAYPNPFKDRVFIKFTSPVSGKAVVEIYDMTGRRLEVMNKGTVVAGRENLVEYMVPAANRNSIIYRVTVDKFSVNGRLISPSK